MWAPRLRGSFWPHLPWTRAQPFGRHPQPQTRRKHGTFYHVPPVGTLTRQVDSPLPNAGNHREPNLLGSGSEEDVCAGRCSRTGGENVIDQ